MQSICYNKSVCKNSRSFAVVGFSKEVNANSGITINIGMLAYIDSEDSLAGLIGHEITHRCLRPYRDYFEKLPPNPEEELFADKIYNTLDDYKKSIYAFIPFLGNTISFYDAMTGYDFWTNEKLSSEERRLAAAGIFLAGFTKTREAKTILEILHKEAKDVSPKTIAALENLSRDNGLKEAKIVSSEFANNIAKPFYSETPFKETTECLKRITQKDEIYIRVFKKGETNPLGNFVMRQEDFEGLTAKELQ